MTYWSEVFNNFLTMICLYCEIFCYLFIALAAVFSAIKSVFYIFGVDKKIKQRKAKKVENNKMDIEKMFSDARAKKHIHDKEESITVNFSEGEIVGTMKIGDTEYKVYLGNVVENNIYDNFFSEKADKMKSRIGLKKFTLIQYDSDYEETKG